MKTSRRNFLAAATGAFISTASASTPLQLIERISWSENPGFLPVFLERFKAFHDSRFALETRWRWPKPLLHRWREDFSLPRDFAEELGPGLPLWPRFQWVHEFTDEGHDPLAIEWFDLRTPEKLRGACEKAFSWRPARRDWVGFTWNPRARIAEFHFPWRENGRLIGWESTAEDGRSSRRSKFTKRDGLWILESDAGARVQCGEDPPDQRFDAAKVIRLLVGREFSIGPRSRFLSADGRRERLYFP